jgi:hypothetical protein
MYQKSVEGWPVIVQVLDWNKVDQLLNQVEAEAKSEQSAA